MDKLLSIKIVHILLHKIHSQLYNKNMINRTVFVKCTLLTDNN